MKTIVLLVATAITCWGIASAKVRASLAVAGESLEERIAATAGKGRVAVKLNEKRLRDLREAAIQAKALHAHYTALAAENAPRVVIPPGTLDRLKKLEEFAVGRFHDEHRQHLEFTSRLRLLNEQLTTLKTLSGGIDSVQASVSPATEDLESAAQSLEFELRRAEAEVEMVFAEISAAE